MMIIFHLFYKLPCISFKSSRYLQFENHVSGIYLIYFCYIIFFIRRQWIVFDIKFQYDLYKYSWLIVISQKFW